MTTPQPSRRKFLKTGCLTAAAIGITLCGGGSLIGTYQPPVDQPNAKLGPGGSENRVLITYATKAGSTAETALRMGETLSKQGLQVDIVPVTAVKDITPYQAIIVGSAIRMGNVLPEVKNFIEANQAALQQKIYGQFILCMTLNQDTAENRQKVSAYLDPLRAMVKPASEGLFAGKIDPSKLTLFDKTLAVDLLKSQVGDFRQWDQILPWAENLVASLRGKK